MVKCPNCGAQVAVAIKSWPVSFKKKEDHAKPKFLLGIFKCPKCTTKFRARIESSSEPAEAPKLHDLVKQVKGIREGLIQARNTLHERIGTFETERGSLMLELGDLEKDAESRADALESEVCQLREEIKSLKELLGSTGEDAK